MDMHFEGVVFHTYADELARRVEHAYPPFAILDVRSQAEHDRLRIPGSLRVDADELTSFPEGIGESTELFVVGARHTDNEVRAAALALKELGARRVVELTGGLWEWVRRGLPLEGSQAA
ncbi:MAG: rhodanese-like domain-containing protein [Thermoanaerobaculia bacterium]